MTPADPRPDFLEEFNRSLDEALEWMAWLIFFSIVLLCGIAAGTYYGVLP